MKVVISGASGLIGRYLSSKYIESGHAVIALTRSAKNVPLINGLTDVVEYDYQTNILPKSISNTDLVINLTGKNIVTRWTKSNKQIIYSSRVESTKYLVEALSKLSTPPKMLASASAIGYYGDTQDQIITEQTSNGSGYFSNLCIDWENAALKAESYHIKTTTLRTGIVLSENGGAFSRMLIPFKLGLGSKFGSGKQIWSWVHIEDVFRALEYLRVNNINGPVNIVAPGSISQSDFGRQLAYAVHMPFLFKIPQVLLKIALGEMSTELLSSKTVSPEKLTNHGFKFLYPDIEKALSALLQ